MISPEMHAEIRRLFYAEHWKVGTIACSLKVHRDAVLLASEADRFRMPSARPRVSRLDPYVPFIKDTLERYPRLRSTRLWQMLNDRNCKISVNQLRRVVAKLRPVPRAEAYLRLRVLPGEQAQVDWGCFGTVGEGRSQRPLSCFVMVLSWSRAIHAVFTLDQTIENFLRGHVEGFNYFGRVPRVILYDNLKSAVLERRSDAVRFHPRLLELCAHYHFAARPCSPARGNEKGRVERQIQYLRTSFFAARGFRDVDDLNAQFRKWRDEVAHQRQVPGESSLTVGEALQQERAYLLALPEHPFETETMRVLRSGKTPYVRFDRNDYSIPHELVRKPITLLAGPKIIRILDGEREVARHDRSYATGATIENPAHIEKLLEKKRRARALKGRDRLRAGVPETDALFDVLALRGDHLGYHTTRLLGLLDDYGVRELRAATREAIEREAFSAGSIAHILEQRRRARGLVPPIRVEITDPRVRDLRVTSHRLEEYDAIGQTEATEATEGGEESEAGEAAGIGKDPRKRLGNDPGGIDGGSHSTGV